MTYTLIWQSQKFDPSKVVAVYARGFSDGTVKLFDVDAKSKTIREYWVKRESLSVEQLAAIDAQDVTRAYNQVRIDTL